jgi:predicted Zn-dependent protease with MMP-like domain
MIQIREEEFEALVLQALELLPPAFRAQLEHVVVDIEPLPDRATAQDLGLVSRRRLLGLFRGVALPDQSVSDHGQLPSRITIYRDNIRRVCRTKRQIVEQVRKTVLHEIGHHFGLDEGDLRDLGYG